jgi:hypothetical protein
MKHHISTPSTSLSICYSFPLYIPLQPSSQSVSRNVGRSIYVSLGQALGLYEICQRGGGDKSGGKGEAKLS